MKSNVNNDAEFKEFKDLRELLKNSVSLHSNEDAFILKNKCGQDISYTHVSYKQFQDDINYLGTSFFNLGLNGKRIAIIGKNCYEWAVTYFATVNGTGITVPLDKGLPEQEIESLLQRSYANAVIFGKDYLNTMREIKKRNSTQIQNFICMEENPDFPSFTELINMGKEKLNAGDTRFLTAPIDEQKMSMLLFTSGTTSISKAVMLSHKNITSNIYALSYVIKIYPSDVNMAFLPFHHTFGSTGLIFFLSHGVTNVFCDGLKYIQKNLVEYKVSIFVCVPLLLEAMYKKIWKEIDKQDKTKIVKLAIKISNFLLKFKIDIRRKIFKSVLDQLGGSIRFAISGAAAIDKTVAKGFHDFGITAIQGYGLTETSPVLIAERESAIRYGSTGFPLCNVQIKIDNPNENGIGEIVAKGPNVMLGYYENEEATKEVLKDGWFYTGDLGYIDKDGYIYISGRKKNVIVLKNGKNIYPEELEILINKFPYVDESMVFGMPKGDDLLLSAKIVYNTDYVQEHFINFTKEQLEEKIWQDIKELNQTLTNYKHIKYLVITDEPMIKTTTQKIKRFEEMKKILES